MEDQFFDVAIIGGGMAGATLAAELAQTRRVLLLERETFCGYHTTGRSAALFTESYGNGTIRALTRASRAFFEAPPSGFATHDLLTPRPVLFVARADQVASLTALETELAAEGGRPQRLGAAEAKALIPILREDYVAAGLLEHGARDIDVHALHQGYLRAAKTGGVHLVTGAAVDALDRSQGAWNLTTTAGSFRAGIVVNAAGAWAGLIGGMAGAAPVVLTPLRRTAMILDLPAGVDPSAWPIAIDIDEEFYFKPDAGRLLVSPADETPSEPCDAQPEELDIAIAVHRVQQAADLPVRTVGRRWAGLRTFAADRTPVIGFDSRAENFFWMAGQGGYGIQMAPALARAAAALLCGNHLPDDILEQGFNPARVAPDRSGIDVPVAA